MKKKPLQFAQAFGHEASDKRLDILRRIGELGSISQAARSAQVSYKGAWQALETLSNLAGAPLVEKAVGGSGGGGARLTQAGIQLLEAAQLLHQARATVLSQLAQRSDNSLRMSGLMGLGLRTSMRNQLPCQIASIKKASGTARVQLELASGTHLVARITQESAALLGLRVGMPALALCKATAVTMGAALPAAESTNRISGEVLSSTAMARGGEIAMAIRPGLNLIGFAADKTPLSVGQAVEASVQESAIVIALPG